LREELSTEIEHAKHKCIFIFPGQLSQYSTASAFSCHLSYFTFFNSRNHTRVVISRHLLLPACSPPIKSINNALFHFHKQLSYSMHISCCNIIAYCQTEESLALIADQKLLTFKGLFTHLIFFICGLIFLVPFVHHCAIAKLPSFFLILILFTKTTFILLQFVKLIKYILEYLKKATVSFPSATLLFCTLCVKYTRSNMWEGIFYQS